MCDQALKQNGTGVALLEKALYRMSDPVGVPRSSIKGSGWGGWGERGHAKKFAVLFFPLQSRNNIDQTINPATPVVGQQCCDARFQEGVLPGWGVGRGGSGVRCRSLRRLIAPPSGTDASVVFLVVLHRHVMGTSNPCNARLGMQLSPGFGQHLTKAAIIALVAPGRAEHDRAVAWVQSQTCPEGAVTIGSFYDALKVTIPVACAERCGSFDIILDHSA